MFLSIIHWSLDLRICLFNTFLFKMYMLTKTLLGKKAKTLCVRVQIVIESDSFLKYWQDREIHVLYLFVLWNKTYSFVLHYQYVSSLVQSSSQITTQWLWFWVISSMDSDTHKHENKEKLSIAKAYFWLLVNL